ncbi:MAG: sialate O-acetylesterase [Candidatus Binatia bacterium]
MLALSHPAAPAWADVNLTPVMPDGVQPPALFSNGMVVQREMTVPIFGRADAGEEVTVTFNGQQKTTTTGGDGRWRVDLDPMPAGGPLSMTIEGNNTIVLTDVLIGEVWVTAGQSNMTRRRIRRSTLALNPTIRTLVRRGWSDQPGLTPFTFAQNLQASLGVPIGILNLASGGSNAVLWLGKTAESDPDPDVQQYLFGGWGSVYAKFVKPIQPFRIRGVVWWQGEADARRPEVHRTLYPAVLRSWRTEWGIGDFPWISMQVPTGRGLQADGVSAPLPVNASASDKDAFLRHTYVRALEEFPYTSFASSLDLEGGIHPRDTAAYSKRLSDQALALVYGHDIAYAGPMYSSMEIEGAMIRIHYRAGTAVDLDTRDAADVQGFAITGDNVTWHWADAAIDGQDVLLSSVNVPSPIAARYAWANRPTWANLVNGAGLAASAFATDVTPGEFGP